MERRQIVGGLYFLGRIAAWRQMWRHIVRYVSAISISSVGSGVSSGSKRVSFNPAKALAFKEKSCRRCLPGLTRRAPASDKPR